MFERLLDDHLKCMGRLAAIKDNIIGIGKELLVTIQAEKRIFICGNGGSAADAQHFAAEMVGRFEKEKKPIPALALTTDSSILTALSNDYSFDDIFSKQIEALGSVADVLIGISTSGNSKNVFNALNMAKERSMKSIALLGESGGGIKEIVDMAVMVPSDNTARVQEAHIFILHFWAKMIEDEMFHFFNTSD